jgi:uncharacterized protein YecT (DUF1311 family)
MKVVLLLLALCGAAHGQCEDRVVTLALSTCLRGELKKANVELNRVYGSTMKKLDGGDLERLRKAQRVWLAYRYAQCDAEYQLWGGGSGGPPALLQCQLKLTQSRTKEMTTLM